MPLLRRYWPYLILVLAPLLALWPAVLLGKVIGPFDEVRAMAPWNGPAPDQPWDVLQADGVLQFYPWRDLVFSAWGQGRIPFWNPYEFAGAPLLANSQSAPLYPPHILLGLLHVPTATAITLLAWLHLAWAALGAYFLTRKLGASHTGGVVAGVSFALSPYMVAWTGLPSVITTACWIPWVLGLTTSLFRGEHVTSFSPPSEDGNPRTLNRLIRRTMLLGFALAMMLLGGHLQLVAYGGMGALLIVAWLLAMSFTKEHGRAEKPSLRHPGIRGLAAFAVAGVLGFAMAAPQVLPALEYAKFSHRQNVPTEEGYSQYQAGALQPFELIGLVHSNLQGEPASALPEYKQQLPAYWPGFVQRGANFAETAIGIGPLVLGLLLLARRRLDWKIIGGVGLMGLAAFLLATGTALGRLLYFGVPGWSATGSPGRISVLFVLATCALAGVSATLPPSSKPKEKWQLYAPVAGLAVVSLATIYALMFAVSELKSWMPVSDNALQSIIAAATGRPKALAAVSTLIAALAVGYWLKENRKPGWALVVAALVCFPLSVPSVLRFSDSADLRVEGPPFERVAVVNGPWDLLTRAPAVAPPNTLALSRVHELSGYDSLIHRDTDKMLADIDGKDPAAEANGNLLFVKKSLDIQKLADAGVTEVWQRTPKGLEKATLDGKGRAYTPAGAATLVREDTQSLHLHATGPGKLIVKDRNMPGWMAKIDGRHVPLGGYLWREVEVPAGEHHVEFNYVPPGFMKGVYMAFPAWLLMVAVLAISTFALKRTTPRPNVRAEEEI